MTTPEEVKLLLDGDAPESLMFSLVEMINKGDVDLTGIPRALINNPVVLSMRQESFARGDERYAMLGIDTNNLREYLFQIGELLNPEQKQRAVEVPSPDAVEDFCLDPEPPRKDVSEEQVLMNLDASIVAKQKELENLCEMFNFNNPLQGSLDGVFEFLEVPDWYKAGLDAIAEFINWAFSWLGSQDGNLADSAPARASQTPFENTYSGKEILLSEPSIVDQHYFPQYKRVDMRQNALQRLGPVYCVSPQSRLLVSTPVGVLMDQNKSTNTPNLDVQTEDRSAPGVPAWTEQEEAIYDTNRRLDYQVGFLVKDNLVSYYYFDYLTNQQDLIATCYLSDSNLIYLDRPLDQNRTPNASLAAANNMSIRDTRTPRLGYFPAPSITSEEPVDDQGSMSINGAASGVLQETRENVNNFLALGVNDTPARFVSNVPWTAFTLLKWFYAAPTLKYRLKPYGAALRQSFLVRNDFCENADEGRVADFICDVVWERIRRFMWNVGPIISAYPKINMPDTINSLTDYLYRKYENELEERGVLGVCLQYMWTVEKHYRTIPDNEIVPWQSGAEDQSMSMKDLLVGYTSPRDKMKALFRFSLLGALKRLALEKSFSMSINPLAYTGSSSSYLLLAPELYRFLASEYQGTFTYVENSSLWLSRSQYFTPAPLMIALQYIAFDRIADPISRTQQKNLQYLRQIASADDRLLNGIKGFGAGNIERRFLGSFPRTIGGKTYYSQDYVDRDIVSYEELRKLTDIIKRFRSDAKPVMDKAAYHLANNEGTGAENIFEERLGQIRSVYEDMKASYDLLDPAKLPLLVFSSMGPVDIGQDGGFVEENRNTLSRAVRNQIEDLGEESTFYRSPGNPITYQLWLRLSMSRGDVGLSDDPDLSNFIRLLDEGNEQVRKSYRELQKYYDIYLSFMIDFTAAYPGVERAHELLGTTPSQLVFYISDTLRPSIASYDPDLHEVGDFAPLLWNIDVDYEDPLTTTGRTKAISIDAMDKFLSDLKKV